jgi:cobyrinic acid a,c-diamide synthase
LDCSDISSDPKNDNVELIMQKYEADIRAHVKMQKEMQKLAEALQIKLEDSENVGQIGEQKFLDLERRHYGLLGDLNSVKEENRKLKVLLEEIDKYVKTIFCLGLLLTWIRIIT